MDNKQIAAVGFLLSTYEGDLNYFANFARFSNGEISSENYCQKAEGTFKNFINEYRVARNTRKGSTSVLLNCALDWRQKGQAIDVDGFALNIKKLTHGKVATSLASKIMYLMNPVEVLPVDSRVRAAFQLRSNNYVAYLAEVRKFKEDHEAEIRQSLETVARMLEIIESPFVGKIRDLEKIRENRFVDKWLWVKGGNK